MQRNPVRWFEIYVRDMPRARAFYEAVLAVRLERLPDPGPGIAEMWAFPSQPEGYGAAGALVRMDGMPGGGNAVIVYFGCDDCATEAKRAAENGGRVVKDKFPIGRYGFIALVEDTEGTVIGLHSMQ